MKSAKGNILSLWKVMKGLLSAIRKKRLKESAESWQNTATESGSSFSEPRKETADNLPFPLPPKPLTDAEILNKIEKIKFRFGNGEHTLKEAGMMFMYECGLDLGEVYCIVLTERFGTVIFYIPDDLIMEIWNRIGYDVGFHEYLADLIEFRKISLRLELRMKPNNWLKMHGYAMRRGRKGNLRA